MLGVAGDAGIREPRVERGPRRDVDDLEEARDPCTADPFLDCLEQLVDASLGGVGPLGHRNDVDLPAVQARRDDPGREPTLGETRHREVSRPIECRLLDGRCLSPVEQAGSRFVDGECLRASVQGEQQPSRPARSGPELAVHVPDMGATDDRDVDAALAQCLDELAHVVGVGGAIGDRRTVPVEDHRLEAQSKVGGCHRQPLFVSRLVHVPSGCAQLPPRC